MRASEGLLRAAGRAPRWLPGTASARSRPARERRGDGRGAGRRAPAAPRRRAGSPVFVSASGIELVTDDGRRVLDAASGVGVTCLGSTNRRSWPRWRAKRVSCHTCTRCASRRRSWSSWRAGWRRWRPASSTAASYARAARRRSRGDQVRAPVLARAGAAAPLAVVGRRPSFHGNTIAALSLGWHGPRRARHAPLLVDFPRVDAPNSYPAAAVQRQRLRRRLRRAAGRIFVEREIGEEVAASSPSGRLARQAGCARRAGQLLQAVRGSADRHGVLFIADEGRRLRPAPARWFGIER